MDENKALDDLKTIRGILENSSKYISFSGLSGVLAGIFALFGGLIGWWRMESQSESYSTLVSQQTLTLKWLTVELLVIGALVFICSVISAAILTIRHAKRNNKPIWNKVANRMVVNAGSVILAGAGLEFVLIINHDLDYIVPVALLFYGCALLNISHFTRKELSTFGYGMILLGLFGLLIPQYAILYWCLGFGFGHILYGLILYLKYDRKAYVEIV